MFFDFNVIVDICWVIDGKFISLGGIFVGIDMSLVLVVEFISYEYVLLIVK